MEGSSSCALRRKTTNPTKAHVVGLHGWKDCSCSSAKSIEFHALSLMCCSVSSLCHLFVDVSQLLRLVFRSLERNASINTSDHKDAEPQKLASCFAVERRNVFADCFSFETQLLCDTKPWVEEVQRAYEIMNTFGVETCIYIVLRNNTVYIGYIEVILNSF